jgi:hypothetical protein
MRRSPPVCACDRIGFRDRGQRWDACPFGPRTLGFCAKQTQFGPRQHEGQVVCGQGVMAERTCKEHWKNKAKLGQAEASGGTVSQGGYSCDNASLPGVVPATKPISAVRRGTGILPVSLDHRQDADATVRPDGGRCAKQTQLPEAGHRGGVRLRREGRGLGDVGRGANAPNKPNLHLPGRIGGASPALHGLHRAKQSQWGGAADCAKQSQFPPRCQAGQRLARKGVMVNSTSGRLRQNKANFRLRRAGRGPRGGGIICETKPILRLRIADWVQTWSGTCETKPIWPGLGRARFRADERCETKPIRHPPRWDQRDRSRETKPNSPPGGVGRGRPTHEETIMRHRLDAPLRETKPNLGELEYLGHPAAYL